MGGTILVVEDSSDLRAVYDTFLGAEGYHVVSATDAPGALRVLHQELPDLILLDIGLPRISGWDLLQVVREREQWRDIPVIVVTALRDPASLTHGWSLGCTCYLRKPFLLGDLRLLVQRLMADVDAPTLVAAG